MVNRLKVLIVDDDIDACTSLRRILQMDNIGVDIAHSVSEMFSPRTWSDYFAILLDRKLPDGSAEELLPRARAKAPNASIVIITGFADIESSITAFRAGAEDYIVKPIDADALRATLDRLSRVRLAEERARQVERLAVIGQVVATVAHESRNFLQLIGSAVESLKDIEQNNSEAIDVIQQVEKAEQSLARLLEDLRQFAAPIELDKHRHSLRRVWQDAWNDLARTRSTENAKINDATGDIDLQCDIDEFRMGQVFRNLFANSIDACGENAILLLHCESLDDTCRIIISDNGPGLTPVQRENLFRPFFTTKSKGTGLGLAIVKRIIEAHGGDIQLGDREAGAQFILTLPVG